MKKTLLLLVICLVAAHPLSAQNNFEKWTGQVGAGFTVPVGDANDRVDTGWNLNVAAGPRFNERWSLLFDFTWSKFGLKDSVENNSFNLNLRDLDGRAKVWSISANPQFAFVRSESFTSYVTGGYGVYNRTVSIDSATRIGNGFVCDDWLGFCTDALVVNDVELAKQSTYKGGYNAGAGVTIGSTYKFFAEVRYHHMFTTNQSTQIIPVTFGFRW